MEENLWEREKERLKEKASNNDLIQSSISKKKQKNSKS